MVVLFWLLLLLLEHDVLVILSGHRYALRCVAVWSVELEGGDDGAADEEVSGVDVRLHRIRVLGLV